MSNFLLGKIAETPLKTESLVDKVVKLLEEGIINTSLPPGSNLIEDEIARSLAISRSPVREALLRLESSGLVRKSRKGRVVAIVTPAEVVQYYEIWEMTSCFGGGLACRVAMPSDLQEVEQVLEEMKSLLHLDDETMVRYRALNYRFHMATVAPCPNPHIVQLHRNAMKRIQWCWNLSISWPRDFQISYTEHKSIYDAYRQKDRELFEKKIREHVRNAGERFQAEYAKKRGA